MDAYLDVAVEILRTERRPLSPHAILAEAYRRAVVPPYLHGKTQHKTLHARISEDIVHRREHSPFFRTAPGKFFLREFLTDETIAEEFRRPFPARWRFRELVRGPALGIDYNILKGLAENMLRRSIGFSTFVHRDEHTLFNVDTLGIVDSGVWATKIDLDIPEFSRNEAARASLRYFLWASQGSDVTELLAVIRFECPRWFEPLKRRLALNDVAWLDTTNPVNDIDDFDPWSRSILIAHYNAKAQMGSGDGFASYSSLTG